jgi:hypothetical protein
MKKERMAQGFKALADAKEQMLKDGVEKPRRLDYYEAIIDSMVESVNEAPSDHRVCPSCQTVQHSIGQTCDIRTAAYALFRRMTNDERGYVQALCKDIENVRTKELSPAVSKMEGISKLLYDKLKPIDERPITFQQLINQMTRGWTINEVFYGPRKQEAESTTELEEKWVNAPLAELAEKLGMSETELEEKINPKEPEQTDKEITRIQDAVYLSKTERQNLLDHINSLDYLTEDDPDVRISRFILEKGMEEVREVIKAEPF